MDAVTGITGLAVTILSAKQIQGGLGSWITSGKVRVISS